MSVLAINDALKASQELGPTRVFKKVMSRCLLLTMTVSRWRGAYQIDKAELTSDGKVIPAELVTPGRWKLIPDEHNKALNAIETEARAMLARHSVPFSMPAVYIVPIDSADNLFEGLKRVREKLNEEADKFCAPENYKKILQRVWEKTDGDRDLFQAVKKVLPTRQQIRSKFGIKWALVPIGMPNEDFADNPSEFIREARQETKRIVQESIDTLLSEPRQELAAALENLSGILERGQGEGARSSVRQASIDNVRAALQKLQSFNFVADDSLLTKMQQLDMQLKGTTPKQLNSSPAAAQNLGQMLKEIAVKARDDDAALQKFDRFSRALDFED